MTDLEDDWFFDSIQMYKDLYMYDLQQPVTAMDWIDDGTRLLVAVSSKEKHELAEMSLPDKVLKADTENSGLIKDRDFRMVNGGFCDHPVMAVKHIPCTRIVCTSPKPSSGSDIVELWQLGKDDTDLIQKICDIKNKNPKHEANKITVIPQSSSVVFGSHLDNICIADVNTKQIIQDSQDTENTDMVSVIHFADEKKLVCCCQTSGNAVVLDTREKLKIVESSSNIHGNKATFWTQDLGKTQQHKTCISQLSSGGHVNILDLRNLSSNVECFNTELDAADKTEWLTIKVSLNNEEQFSVSGFDSNVYVYGFKGIADQNNGDKLEPLFIHEGHLRNSPDQLKDSKVVTHLWHPWQPNLILSAANDGSLHGWQYNTEKS